jgi:hypothetical protein
MADSVEKTESESSNLFNIGDESAQRVFSLMQGLSDHMMLSFHMIASFCYVLNIYREAIKNSKNPALAHLKTICSSASLFAEYGKKWMTHFPDQRQFRYNYILDVIDCDIFTTPYLFRAYANAVSNYVGNNPSKFTPEILSNPHSIATVLAPFPNMRALVAESISPEKKELDAKQKELKVREQTKRNEGKKPVTELVSKDLDILFGGVSDKVFNMISLS